MYPPFTFIDKVVQINTLLSKNDMKECHHTYTTIPQAAILFIELLPFFTIYALSPLHLVGKMKFPSLMYSSSLVYFKCTPAPFYVLVVTWWVCMFLVSRSKNCIECTNISLSITFFLIVADNLKWYRFLRCVLVIM